MAANVAIVATIAKGTTVQNVMGTAMKSWNHVALFASV